MKTAREGATRRERLYVRLTAEEAAHVADLAGARGLRLSDFVRTALLRGRGRGGRPLFGRRAMARETASAVRQLGAVAVDLSRLVQVAQADGAIRPDVLDACLIRVRAVIAVFGP
jgi:hypothetical protein